ncbi:MAG: LysR family transcriptional regulator [Bdellovibrionaceae bacterium]|nr:LysR family transcriptional regulator [Pseudobdellovibrionaceae bacterium]MBX3032516.1 LysR family transcriptional regulator [Pseudobdellovibrionaceae bacterium]
MRVPSLQLEAFYEVAQTRHFTQAALNLRLTQSALSQRILNLEGGLGATLFIRERRSLRLTEAGERLLRYCRQQNLQEEDLLQEIQSGHRGLGGWLRVAGFSSVIWSVAVPALSAFVRDNGGVRVDFQETEMAGLIGLLKDGGADLILTAEKPEGFDGDVWALGSEEYVMVHSARVKGRRDVYLDHDATDEWTKRFFKRNARSISGLRREYMDNIHGLLEGVAAGWGSAVLPRHLVKNRADLKIDPSFKTLKTPVLLVRHRQSHPTRLLEAVTAELKRESGRWLAAKG